MIVQLAALLSKPFLSKLPVKPEVKDKFKSVGKLLTGASNETWIPLARQQVTLPVSESRQAMSNALLRGQAMLDGKAIDWVQFDWTAECRLADCAIHDARWRIYRNGLICLAMEVSKDGPGLDASDLLGHQIEPRDKAGFPLGIWCAAFVIRKHQTRQPFQASAIDDHLPLKLHFDEIDGAQAGTWLRI